MEIKKINALREYIKNTKAERYPIENEYFKDKEDYVKNLYLKMLAAIILQGEEADEAKTTFFGRLVAGISTDNDSKFYIKEALEISTEDFEGFVEEFSTKPIKYRFALDALLLLTISEYNEEQTELVAGIIESLKIGREDMKFMFALTVCIMELDKNKDFSDYNAPKEFELDFIIDYLRLFPSCWVCLTKEKLIFINVEDDKNKDRYIKTGDSKYVYIKNRSINSSLNFKSFVEKLYIEDCELSDVNSSNRIINAAYGAGYISIKDSQFRNCVYNYNSNSTNYWEPLGGVIYSENDDCKTVISGCEFTDIKTKNSREYSASAIICKSNNADVSDCIFANCWNYHKSYGIGGEYVDSDSPKRTLFAEGTVNNNNKVINSADFS